MSSSDLFRKCTSRKFLLSLAAFIAAFVSGASGVMPPEWCALGMALTAGIYAACEAYVDGQSARANGTSVAISAASTDKETVKSVIAPDGE